MNYLIQALREHQELAVFLTLAIGFFIGRLRIGTSADLRTRLSFHIKLE